jgi:GNAT superfamily N-acetyltransferase
MSTEVRPAGPEDTDEVSAILTEAAAWLTSRGTPMWRADELRPERIAHDVRSGTFHVAVVDGRAVGTIKFELSDTLFWPDLPHDDSAFVHRLAVRRSAAGQGVSTALLAWAATRAADLGRRFVRLDCEASRTPLRAFYERFGFRHHSNRQVGPYFVARYELPVPVGAAR